MQEQQQQEQHSRQHASMGQQQQQHPEQPGALLGHVFVELVRGSGFPFCSLLQLPTPDDSSTSSSGDLISLQPGAVVLRLPISGLQSIAEFGQQQQFNPPAGSSGGTGVDGDNQWQQQQQQQQQQQEPSSLLPGPHALQALLHELGHALSYLCPFLKSAAAAAGPGRTICCV